MRVGVFVMLGARRCAFAVFSTFLKGDVCLNSCDDREKSLFFGGGESRAIKEEDSGGLQLLLEKIAQISL